MCVCVSVNQCTNTRSPRRAEVSASVEAETDASECGFSRCEEGASPCNDGPESPPDLAPEAARSLCLEAPHLAGRQGNCPAANASEVRLNRLARSVQEGEGSPCCRWLAAWKAPLSLHEHQASYIIGNCKAHVGARLSKLKTFLENLPTLHFLLCLHFALRHTQFSSATHLCPALCDPMDCTTPGLPVHPGVPSNSCP